MGPRTVIRDSLPVRRSISRASQSPTPDSRTRPFGADASGPSSGTPPLGLAPSATTTIGAYDARKREATQSHT